MFLLSAGNDYIHMLTSRKRQRLRIDLEDWEGNTRYADYDNFRVDSEHEKYKLVSLGTYTGTAGRYGMNNVGVTVLASLELQAVAVSVYSWLMNSYDLSWTFAIIGYSLVKTTLGKCSNQSTKTANQSYLVYCHM